jgi:hypothetical protein
MIVTFILTTILILPEKLYARDHAVHRQGPPPTRIHTAVAKKSIKYEPSNRKLKFTPWVSIEVENNKRIIKSNGVPNHLVGRFPNCGNPHTIEEQSHSFRVPLKPTIKREAYSLTSGWAFGVAVNGIPFEPLAAEWYLGKRNSYWRYEALSGAIALGPDTNHAHVQPGGKYHYHGVPIGLLDKVNFSNKEHSPLIGWAADGFPIYNVYGYKNKIDPNEGVKEYKASFKLKPENRPNKGGPSGPHDGAFSADYEYVAGIGDLDKCNGIKVITPEFPDGTYAYFLTQEWPIIPRCWVAEPDPSFKKRGRRPRSRGIRPADCPKRGRGIPRRP